MLSRTQKVDLRKISVLQLAEQYLKFVRQAAALRIELAADYLVMAAWLAFLKSRLLLPPEPGEAGPSAEDLAAHLAFQLERLQAMREAAARLMARDQFGRDFFARGLPEAIIHNRDVTYEATLLDLMRAERVNKFYFSHLNYAGRGNIHRGKDAQFQSTRDALDQLYDRAWQAARDGLDEEYVTGNNDADGPYLLQWVQARFPRWADALHERLVAWGGNSSGVNVANIDNLGHVHPDTMWWHHTIGDVRQRPFSQIWSDTSEPLMAGLKAFPRPVEGRCASCQHFALCGGNTRTRAQQLTGNPWAEDPGCYLTDEEIGAVAGSDADRLALTPFRKVHILRQEARHV